MYGIVGDFCYPIPRNVPRKALQIGSIHFEESGPAKIASQFVGHIAHAIEIGHPRSTQNRGWLIAFHAGRIWIAHVHTGDTSEFATM